MQAMKGKLEENKRTCLSTRNMKDAEVMVQAVGGLMIWDGVCWVGRLPLAACSEVSQCECCHCLSPFFVRLVKKLVSCSKGQGFLFCYSDASC